MPRFFTLLPFANDCQGDEKPEQTKVLESPEEQKLDVIYGITVPLGLQAR
jgi:hypothetical protein